MNKLIVFAVAWLLTAHYVATAEPKTPFQQMIENDVSFNSRESMVSINGKEYQKIEIENNTYYLVFKGRNGEIPTLLCDRPKDSQSEHLLEGTLKVMRRKSVFVKALKESCITHRGQQRNSVELDPQIGFYLPESEKDKIKKKQIGINPLKPKGLNFSGEF